MSTPPRTFCIPKLKVTFSVFHNNGANPHFERCRPESRAWIQKYENLLYGAKMCVFMNNCKFELLSSYAYPYAGPAGLRATMDLMNIFFIFDEYTDTNTGRQASKAATIVGRALREQDYDDGTWICHMMQDFRHNHLEKFGPNLTRRFVNNFCQYVGSVGAEAVFREEDKVLDIEGYIELRRGASGGRPSFDLAEYCLGIDLPDYVHEDPIFIRGYNAARDLVSWINDLVSYNMEQAKGHSCANIITVIMKSKGIDLQSAIDFVGRFCESLTFQLLESRDKLKARTDPVFSRDAVRCLEAYADWVRGSEEWSFLTERYFGKENSSVKETRVVKLKAPFEDSHALKE